MTAPGFRPLYLTRNSGQHNMELSEDERMAVLRAAGPYVEAWGGWWPSQQRLDDAERAFRRRRLEEEREYLRRDLRDIRLAGPLAQLGPIDNEEGA